MDPTQRLYSRLSEHRIGRPLGADLTGLRFDRVIVSITFAELSDPYYVQAISLAKCRQRDPNKPITVALMRKVPSTTLYVWCVAVPGYLAMPVAAALGGFEVGLVAGLGVCLLVFGVIFGHWLCSRED